ncbi:MAG TPA: LON peptidase substrate-binding domain-containing protein, partial [Anaerolineales bacterium]|nr:LON peptidase substrate-binding domain-containing protein [Anaerolineales bacterium]
MDEMFDLPLFPLHTVLFPGMPLPLHIFEVRYKEMIRFCLENRQSFGVVLIREGQEANGPLAEPYRIGCTARILEVQPQDQGSMNLITLGESRIRIHALSFEQPYLVGKVELFPLQEDDPAKLSQLSMKLSPLVGQYMQLLNQVEEVELDPSGLPEDPIVLAYLAAVLLQVPPMIKQDLLSIERSADFLSALKGVYRREIPLVRAQ